MWHLTDVSWQLPAERVWEGGGERRVISISVGLGRGPWKFRKCSCSQLRSRGQKEVRNFSHIHFWLLTLTSCFSLLSLFPLCEMGVRITRTSQGRCEDLASLLEAPQVLAALVEQGEPGLL